MGRPLACERGGGEGEPGGSPSVSKKGAAWGKHGFPPRERAEGERRSCQLLLEGGGEPGESSASPGLHRSQRYSEQVGDLALRQPAPVGELDQPALVLG